MRYWLGSIVAVFLSALLLFALVEALFPPFDLARALSYAAVQGLCQLLVGIVTSFACKWVLK